MLTLNLDHTNEIFNSFLPGHPQFTYKVVRSENKFYAISTGGAVTFLIEGDTMEEVNQKAHGAFRAALASPAGPSLLNESA